MYTVLRATSRTLADYLTNGFKADARLKALFDTALAGYMTVSLNTPEEMIAGNLQGLSLWLYQVVRDDQRLNAPPERIAPNRLRPTPLPVRLRYLVTPIVTVDPRHADVSPEQEQAILGKAMQLFYDRAILRGLDLTDDLTGTTAEVHVRLEALTLDEISRVWMALKRSYELSVSYEVTVATIYRDREPEALRPVRTAVPEYAVIVGAAAGEGADE